MKKLINVVLASSAAASVTVGVSLLDRAPKSADVPGFEVAAAAAAPAPGVPPLSSDSLAKFQADGSTIAPVTSDLDNVMSLATVAAQTPAFAKAAAEGRVEASLARVTIAGVGTTTDTGEPANGQDAIRDRLVWVVKYHASGIPLLSSPSGVTEKTYEADMVVLFDAVSGDFLMAESI